MKQVIQGWLSGSIKRQVVLVFVAAALAYCLLQWLVAQYVLLPQFICLQRTEAREHVQRCVSVIEHEIHMTSRKAADWAAWDDTYQFVQDVNPEYAQSNLVDDAFISLQIDVLVFCDPQGRIVWQRVFDWRNEADMTLAEFSQTQLEPEHALLAHTTMDSVIEGVWLTEHLPLLVSSMPIITSERKGPARGTLIMGSFLDPNMVSRWASDLSIDFSIAPIPERGAASLFEMLIEIAKTGSSLEERLEQKMIHAYGQLCNVKGDPVLLVEAQVPTKILQQGTTALRYANLSVLIIGTLLLIAVYASLRHTLLQRIVTFGNNFKEIAERQDLAFRVPVAQGDEMCHLQDGLNAMLHSLEESSFALQESENTYRLIFQAVQDCLCVVDNQARVVAANPSTCEVFGVVAETVVGHELVDLVHPEDQQIFNVFFHQVLTRGKETEKLRFLCANGQVLSVSTRGRVTRRQGQTQVLLALRDMVELQEIETSLQVAKQEAESASQFKSGLLRNVTHEMRTPLNRIIGFADILQDEPMSAELLEYVRNIKQGGEELRALIDSILDVSRIEAGTLSLNILPSDIKALVHELKTIGEHKTKKQGLSLVLECDTNLPPMLHTDVDRLRQCLLYLIDNAVKFTVQGSITIRVALTPCVDNPGISFSICDTGPGIPSDLHESIFTPFSQGDGSATRSCGGLGTGLAIAKQLAELLGGVITLQSTVGKGSEFTLIVPLTVQDMMMA